MNQLSAAVASNQTAESISPPMSDSNGVKGSSSRMKLGVNRGSKATKKSEKTSHPNNALPSPGKIMIKILVSSASASMTCAFTGASSAHDISVVEIGDDGAPTTLSRSLQGSGKESWAYHHDQEVPGQDGNIRMRVSWLV